MSPPIRTGPAVVGLETEVLPATAVVDISHPAAYVTVAVPTCRYGQATYAISLSCRMPPRGTGSRQLREVLVQGGMPRFIKLPVWWLNRELTVMLRLVELEPRPEAFAALTEDQLINALTHTLENVREVAFLAIQQKSRRSSSRRL